MNEELAIVKKSLWTCLLEKSTNFYTLHDNEAASVSCGVWKFGHLVTTQVFFLADGEATQVLRISTVPPIFTSRDQSQ